MLDREQAGANAEFVRAEFERAARELETEFIAAGEEGRRAARREGRRGVRGRRRPGRQGPRPALRRGLDERGAEPGPVDRRRGHEPVARRPRPPVLVGRREQPPVGLQVDGPVDDAPGSRPPGRAADGDDEPDRRDAARARRPARRATEARGGRRRAGASGTAKGRTFEEQVHEAIDRLALAQGDGCDAVGDLLEGTRRTGDIVVGVGAACGPTRGRIVFEAKSSRLSQPKALEELDRALTVRSADYAILVVPSEADVPARMTPLREYNGDKLVVALDPPAPGELPGEGPSSRSRSATRWRGPAS